MGTGQMLLTIGAIMLLGAVILSTNRGISNSSQVMLKTNFGLEAVSLATSVIEEAQTKAFDESTVNSPVPVGSLNLFTQATSLGQEGGDPTDLDDFDDYNGLLDSGYTFPPESLSTGVYKVKTRVYYIGQGNLSTKSATQTSAKRMDVYVWNTASPLDTLKTSTVFCYWYFR